MPSHTQSVGHIKEAQALQQLKAAGMRFIQKNYHCRYGEIDLIMKDKQTIVFVEVRMRAAKNFSSAIESIQIKKQQKIITAANIFLAKHPFWQKFMARFDVVAFSHPYQKQGLWIRDAFREE
jgi:putative endonuclease